MVIYMSEELQEKARKEVNEIISTVPDDLSHIKNWLKKQPHLRARTDDLWLLNFLRGCKFNLEGTKRKLDYFYQVRALLPEFFENRDPFSSDIQEILKLGIVLPLLSENFNGVIIRWKGVDPQRISLENIVKVGLMIFDIGLYENKTCMVTGQYVIDDLQDFPASYALQGSPIFLKKIIREVRRAYPNRIKAFLCINTPNVLKRAIDLARNFLPEKLKSRFHCYGRCELTKIQEFIPLHLIPEEYGGKGPTVDKIAEEWKSKVESYRDWFLEDAQYYSNETKRPKSEIRPTDYDEFSVNGHFRKLEID